MGLLLAYLLLALVVLVTFGFIAVLAFDAVRIVRQLPYVDRPHVLHDAAREAWRMEHERQQRENAAAHPVSRLRRLFARRVGT